MNFPRLRFVMVYLTLATSVAVAQEPLVMNPAARRRGYRLPDPAPYYFSHHHASTEVGGALIGYGFATHGYGLGSKYYAEGLYIRELARRESLETDYDEFKRVMEKQERYRDKKNIEKAAMKSYNQSKAAQNPPRAQVPYVTPQQGIQWPAELLAERFDKLRLNVEIAYADAVRGGVNSDWMLRTQLRSLAEEVAAAVRLGVVHHNTHATAVTFERLVGAQTAEIRKAAANAQP